MSSQNEPDVQCAKCRACRGMVYDWKTNGHKRCPDCAAREAGAGRYVCKHGNSLDDPHAMSCANSDDEEEENAKCPVTGLPRRFCTCAKCGTPRKP